MADIMVRGNASKFGDLQKSGKGNSYMRFLMTEERRVLNDGAWETDGVAFYNSTAFGKAAETLDKMVREGNLKGINLMVYGRLEPSGTYTDRNGETKQGSPQLAVNAIGLDLTNGDYGLRKVKGEVATRSNDGDEDDAPATPKKAKPAPKKKPDPEPEDDNLFDDEDGEDLFGDDDDLFGDFD